MDPHDPEARLFLHYGDLSDAGSLVALLRDIQPDEIYNLGAQSHVRVSFDIPSYTADVTGMGALRLLEAVTVGWREQPLLSGFLIGDVRIDSAAAERGDPLPPAQPVRLREGLRVLGRP